LLAASESAYSPYALGSIESKLLRSITQAATSVCETAIACCQNHENMPADYARVSERRLRVADHLSNHLRVPGRLPHINNSTFSHSPPPNRTASASPTIHATPLSSALIANSQHASHNRRSADHVPRHRTREVPISSTNQWEGPSCSAASQERKTVQIPCGCSRTTTLGW
jgi:hypothetical protein